MAYESIRHRLKTEIILCESFDCQPVSEGSLTNLIDFLFSKDFAEAGVAKRLRAISYVYPRLFQLVPVIRILFPQHLIESQLLLYTKEEFCKKLKVPGVI